MQGAPPACLRPPPPVQNLREPTWAAPCAGAPPRRTPSPGESAGLVSRERRQRSRRQDQGSAALLPFSWRSLPPRRRHQLPHSMDLIVAALLSQPVQKLSASRAPSLSAMTHRSRAPQAQGELKKQARCNLVQSLHLRTEVILMAPSPNTSLAAAKRRLFPDGPPSRLGRRKREILAAPPWQAQTAED